MSFHLPPHKHVGDEGKPGQAIGHLSSSDNIPSPLGTRTGKEPFVPLSHIIKGEDLPAGVRKARTNGDRLLETFVGAAACKLWWPTDTGT